jgi:LysR family transcriptional regulator, glycine cleavage system transcriptional activator
MSESKSHKKDRIPPLHSLQVFEAAARYESFVKAAADLCVTHGAVSRQVRQLEESLGIALFERRNRAVFLTVQGRVLFTACSQAITQIRDVVRELSASAALAPLVVSCEPTIAMRWLIPRLPNFRAKHTEFEVHLLTAGGAIDFRRDRVDLALRRNDFSWSEQYHVARIAPEIMAPVCTPAIATLLREGRSNEVRQLHTRTRPNAWAQWLSHATKCAGFGETEYFEHFYLSLQGAKAGLGIAMGSLYMVEEDMRNGNLVAPYGFAPDDSEYVLLSSLEFKKDARASIFMEWLRYEMQTTRANLDEIYDAHSGR